MEELYDLPIIAEKSKMSRAILHVGAVFTLKSKRMNTYLNCVTMTPDYWKRHCTQIIDCIIYFVG